MQGILEQRNDLEAADTYLTLQRAIQDCVLHLDASGRTNGTIADYVRNFERLTKFIGNPEISTINDSDLDRAVQFLRGADNTYHNRSRATMNKIKSVYRADAK